MTFVEVLGGYYITSLFWKFSEK